MLINNQIIVTACNSKYQGGDTYWEIIQVITFCHEHERFEERQIKVYKLA